MTYDDKPVYLKVFQSVVWPAVAGNVAWAAITLTVLGSTDEGLLARISLLACISVYLIIAWIRAEALKLPSKHFGYGDASLSLSIAALSIAAQAHSGVGSYYMFAVFFSLALGRVLIEVGKESQARRWPSCLTWIAIYATGAAIALFGTHFGGDWGWHLFLSAFLVLLVWLCASVLKLAPLKGLRAD